jgi:crooked neck
MPENCGAWAKFAELEQTLGEEERVRAVYELAISQEGLDMPEVLWKAYIDFEVAEAQPGRARALYERLLERTQHVKVWTTFANFEASGGDGIVAARTIFQRGYDFLKEKGLKEVRLSLIYYLSLYVRARAHLFWFLQERVILLDSWRQCEKAFGDKESLATVDAMLPRKFKKKRMVTGEGGVELGWEEFYDYAFPDEKSEGSANLMILEKAKQWALKRKAAEMSSEPS